MIELNVVPAQFGKRAPSGTAIKLRELADAVERGDVKGVICCYVADNLYHFGMWGSSIESDLVLATLLHKKTIEQFYE